MGKVTIVLTALSTALMLIAFGKGITALRAGDVTALFHWSMAALLGVLTANCVAMVHAAQSDRIIRELRRAVAAAEAKQ
jgi:hypothetical protein